VSGSGAAGAATPAKRGRGAAGAAGTGGANHLRVTLVKSVHGQLANIAASIRGLGLRRLRQTVTVAASRENLGMIRTAAHLLEVEEA
jgi:large subunit ribosomal protein L30